MEHIDFGPRMQQPPVCSPLLEFLVGGGLLGDFSFSFNSHQFILSSSGADKGETVFVPGWVEPLSSKGSLKGIGLHFPLSFP